MQEGGDFAHGRLCCTNMQEANLLHRDGEANLGGEVGRRGGAARWGSEVGRRGGSGEEGAAARELQGMVAKLRQQAKPIHGQLRLCVRARRQLVRARARARAPEDAGTDGIDNNL